MKEIQNPILKGFNPDPSIIRVGDDYYIATSTFEWYPGVQIHHSKDLINWQLVTRPLKRNIQLNMSGEKNSGGIWAPCLSYDNGIFYLIYTDMKQIGISHNYVVTTNDILGDWSEPIFLDGRGFDPSMFHDSDGKKWYVVTAFDQMIGRETPQFKGILLQEYSAEDQKLVGEHKIIVGNNTGYKEAPHLYKRENFYYLIVAEGGTSYEHCVTMARSEHIEGPYEEHPQNPVIRALDTNAYLQKTGHADIVETQNGETYMVFLCGRPLDPKNNTGCILGRETSIQKMEWGKDAWLRLAKGGSVASKMTPAPNLPELKFDLEPDRDNFDSSELNINFQWLRSEIANKIYSLTDRPGYLRLFGKEILTSNYTLSLLARRQQSFVYNASTVMEFNPGEVNQMAGLIVMYSNTLHYYLYVSWDPKTGSYISVLSNDNKEINMYESEPVSVNTSVRIYLKAKVVNEALQFYFGYTEDSYQKIGPILDMSKLSDEYSGGFTGAYVGLCCNDPSTQSKYADFDFFEYIE